MLHEYVSAKDMLKSTRQIVPKTVKSFLPVCADQSWCGATRGDSLMPRVSF